MRSRNSGFQVIKQQALIEDIFRGVSRPTRLRRIPVTRIYERQLLDPRGL
jgi:hypothetical protein